MDQALENNVFDDLTHLEKTLSEDHSGDRARSMLRYFEEVAASSEGMLQRPLDDAERQLAARLTEGFRAAQRIIRHVWETVHTASLPA